MDRAKRFVREHRWKIAEYALYAVLGLTIGFAFRKLGWLPDPAATPFLYVLMVLIAWMAAWFLTSVAMGFLRERYDSPASTK